MSARLLTPPGAGGVAVLELSGPDVREQLGLVWPQARGASIGGLRLVRLRLEDELLDEALVWLESETRAEVHVHGSPPLVRRLLAELERAAPDAAPRNETLEARAAELLGAAPCEAAARILLDQSEGALRGELEAILGLGDAPRAGERLARLVELARVARRCLTPTVVVLVGPVNAGKSTLFNALVGERRAIVSPEAGATRDVLGERARLGDWPIEVYDTAGERELAAPSDAPTALEALGQRLAEQARRDAEWVVRLWPCDGPPPPATRPAAAPGGAPARETWIASRADLGAGRVPGCEAALSAERDPEGAVGTLTGLFRAAFELPERAWWPRAGVPFDPRGREGAARALDAWRGRAPSWRAELRALLDD